MTSIQCTPVTTKTGKPLIHINRIASVLPITIEFEALTYTPKNKNTKDGRRQILQSINGKFSSGEVSAILGPSGAGKTTLLNILAGYLTLDVEGGIAINGSPYNGLKKMSTYIMQDNIIQPFLTVKEAMMYAANFKLNANLEDKDKILMVDEILRFLGMKNCEHTFSNKLSGGERKRLTIALELLGNSPILFLDEPTTGLDDFTVKQCVDLLRNISRLGRTVVCTIHQPPASLFQLFDQVYILASGCCVYNGSPTELVPYLSTTGYPCPSTHTPVDYIIELVDTQQSIIEEMKKNIQNGKINIKENTLERENELIEKFEPFKKPSFLIQFSSLLSRNFVQMRRNKTALLIQLFYHLLSGIGIGIIWGRIGNKAEHGIPLFKCFVAIIMMIVYTYFMIPILLFPKELELIKREIFNGWYNLGAYYLALIVSTLPLLIMLTTMFLIIVYLMTDQPMELHRFFGFCLVGLFEAILSQTWGYFIGTNFNVTKGSIVGSAILIPASVLSTYGYDYNLNIEPFWKFMMGFSFVRHGVVGICNAMFYERGPLACFEDYCPFESPNILLHFLSIIPGSYAYALCNLLIYTVFIHIATYFSLKFRLQPEFGSKILYNVQKFVNICR